MTSLERLVSWQFSDLTEAERRLLAAASDGLTAFCGTHDKDDDASNDARAGESWERNREIRAAIIRWLCFNGGARDLLTSAGIRVHGAKIIGDLDLAYVAFDGLLLMRNCHFSGNVILRYAETRTISLDNSSLPSLRADGLSIRGALILRNKFTCKGVVRLVRASVRGDLDCGGAHFGNENGLSFAADEANIEKSVIFRQASFAGSIRLSQAMVGGDLDCSGATIIRGEAANDPALLADYARIQGNLHLCDEQDPNTTRNSAGTRPTFTTDGIVNLEGAAISGQLHCEGARFQGSGTNGLNFESAKGESIKWRKIEGISRNTILSLINARVGSFFDDEHSWPTQNCLLLDGFSYSYLDPLGDPQPSSSIGLRLRWLQLVPALKTQPYQQLAKVLREAGQDLNARRVLAALQDELRVERDTGGIKRVMSWFYSTIGYGYTPVAGTIRWAAITVVIGWLFFFLGRGHMYQVKPKPQPSGAISTRGDPYYEPISALFYSVDVFLPIHSLHQEDYWLPKAEPWRFAWPSASSWFVPWGWWLRIWLWIEIIAGWVLTGLFLAGLTGFVRQ
ncbi:MAG: hypothetical protein ACREQN_06795 [Candidatus Binataceae bacterium]